MKINTRSSLKDALKKGKLSIGSWITLAHPAIAEIMSKSGFDWIAVDLEHSVITLREAEELIRIISLSGVVPLVRLSSNDHVQIKRVMDAGSHGVIIPMVNSKDDAEKAISSVYYPPRGSRGVGLARAQGYGAEFNNYREWLEQDAIVIVQIEHIKAVENLESILSVDGIDGYIIGPYDISASLGVPGQFDHPNVVGALKRIRDVSSQMAITGGIHVIEPDTNEVIRRIDEGFRFLAYSLDIRILDATCRQGLIALRDRCKLEDS